MLEEWIRGGKQSTGLSWFQSKKGKTVLVIVVSVGLLAILWPVGQITPPPAAPVSVAVETGQGGKSQQIGAQLEHILSQIDGAGTVQVDVMLASEGSREYAHNTREEKRDTSEQQTPGLSKRVVEQSTSLDLAVSAGSPLLVEEKTPEVLGVLVVAEGASNVAVKEQLSSATATLLNIPLHRVMVVAGKGGR
jgi:stage III sporulation protein AG